MTKSVKLGTVEHGLREAYHLLGIAAVATAIENANGQRKSESLLRKYADPDDYRHQLPLRDAFAIDEACRDAGYNPPLLGIYSARLEGESASSPPANPVTELPHLTLAIEAASGSVADAVLQAVSCEHCGCPAHHHADAIYTRLRELERACATLRRTMMRQKTEAIGQDLKWKIPATFPPGTPD